VIGLIERDKMPRKRWLTRLSYHSVIKPEDGDEVDDHDLVRATLVDFEELADLPSKTREQLVADLVVAIGFWRAGVKPGKCGLSDEKEAQHIFISDVGRALKRAGLSATRWRKTYEGDGPDIDAPESVFFRLARGLADAFGRALPKDLKLAGQRASKIQYGVMSPAMEAAQAAELAARGRQRLNDLEPETVYAGLPLELRLLALGLWGAKDFGGSSALAGSSFAG
jgi:hypothetical protein